MQRLLCTTCGEPPEAHFYYYAHHNKQLTIQVKRLNMEKRLPGETEGKLWMWSCCGKCKHHDGNSKSTRRVLISAAARGFSFGKFLELGLSSHSSFRRPSSCGHFLHKDFNYFFGYGFLLIALESCYKSSEKEGFLLLFPGVLWSKITTLISRVCGCGNLICGSYGFLVFKKSSINHLVPFEEA